MTSRSKLLANDLERFRFDISLEDLQTFLAVAMLGSFTRASELLHLSQPTISNRIRRLEEKLLTRLLDRTTHKVELTPQGRRLHLQASETMAALRVVLNEFTGEAGARAREVHIAATSMVASMALPRLIRLFHQEFPTIRIIVHDLLSEEAIAALASGECDLAVLTRSEQTASFQFELLFKDTCVAITQRGHPILRYAAAPLAEVLAERLLIPRSQQEFFVPIQAEADRLGIELRLTPEAQGVRNPFTLLAMAVAGLGICIHPSCFVPSEIKPAIGFVPLKDASSLWEYGIVTPSKSTLSPATKRFRDFLRDSVKAGPNPWQWPEGYSFTEPNSLAERGGPFSPPGGRELVEGAGSNPGKALASTI